MGQNRYPFLEMFPFCAQEPGSEGLFGAFSSANVFEAKVDRESASMELHVEFADPAPPVALTTAEGRIASTYNLNQVSMHPYLKASVKKAKEKAASDEAKMLWGRKIRGDAVAISGRNPGCGRGGGSGSWQGCRCSRARRGVRAPRVRTRRGRWARSALR